MHKGIIGIMVFFCFNVTCFSQADCEQTLNTATEEFNAGHFYGISSMLKPCIDNGFTKEQRQRAYLLLTQSYLLLDDPIGAEDSYLKLLYANPEFIAEPDREPIDVVYLSKKFTSTPIFSLIVKLGGNISFERIINDWTITGSDEAQVCILKPGWQISGGADWNINDKFALTLETGYILTGFRKEVSNIFINDVTEIYDRQHWLSLPLSIKYTHNKSVNFKPYGYIGYSTNLLLGARASLIKTDRTPNSDTGEFSEEKSESATLNFTRRRNHVNRSLILGTGFRYKVGLNYIFVDARYSVGLSNIANERARYFDYSLGAVNDNTSDDFINSGISVFEFAHVDDDFRIDNLSVTFGYVKPLYKPRKLKKARTRTVLRFIKKKKNGAGKN